MVAANAILQAILDHPTDAALRLVYADALEENGGDLARAELIRVQCLLAELPRYDRRRGPLGRRVVELLDAHEKRWLTELAVPIVKAYVEWQRGFVERVVVDASTWLAQGAAWRRTTPLTGVRLFQADDFADELAKSPSLAGIRDLSLAGGLIRSGAIATLLGAPGLDSLSGLDLRLSLFGAFGVETLARRQLPKLSRLQLGFAQIDAENLPLLLRAYPRLTELDLSNQLPQVREGRGDYPDRQLGLRNRIDDNLATALAEAVNPSNGLCRIGLDLASSGHVNVITDKGCQRLARARFPSLERLDLSHSRISDRGLDAILDSDWGQRLTELRFQGCERGAEALNTLLTDPRSRCIRNIEFPAEYDEATIALLTRSIGARRLRRLQFDASENTGRELAAAVATSESLAGLQSLRLRGCPIGNDGAAALSQATFANELITLDVTNAGIGSAGGLALSRGAFPNVTALRANGNEFDILATESLRTQFGRRIDLRGPYEDPPRARFFDWLREEP